MQTDLLRDLEARRASIEARWKDLLMIERAESPLESPAILVHMFKLTLNEFFASLAAGAPTGAIPRAASCPCGRNPLLKYFSSGRQAVEEALVLSQAARPVVATERDAALAEVEAAYGRIARREIDALCAICQFRRPVDRPPAFAAAC